MKIQNKHNKLLFLILALAIFLRTVFLDRLPAGISNDEYYFILSSKNVFFDLINLFKGGWDSQIFQNIVKTVNSETSILLMAPILGLLPSTLFYARIPYVFIGVVTIFLIYKITLKNTKNINLSLLIALIAAINPWSIYVNRTSFDAPVALLFFVLTIYLQSLSNYKYILLSAISSYLAFNGYIGTKVIYLPFMLITSIYSWKVLHHKKYTKSFIFTIIFSIVVTLSFILKLSSSSIGNRRSELIFPSSPQISSQVNDERRQSIQTSYLSVFSNKYTIYFRNFIDKYLYNFSTDILFLNGDHTFMVSLWRMGYFYYLDFLLLIIGIIYLFNHHRNFLIFLVSLILLSPIPESIRADNIPSYAFHSSFQYPFLYIIIGSGAYYLWSLLKVKLLKLAFAVAYIFLFFNFLDIYFNKYPIYQPEGFSTSRYLLANYIKHEQEKTPNIYVVTSEPEAIFRNYIYLTKQYNLQNISSIKNQYLLHPDSRYFQWANITISDQVPSGKDSDTTYIFDSSITNFPFSSETHLAITHLGDAREIFKIYSSQSCQNLSLSTYVSNLKTKDLKFTSLSETDFCQKYISSRQN